MVLKSANYTNRFRISWKDYFKYQVYIKLTYVIITSCVVLNSSDPDIYVYLELCKQKRSAKQRDDGLEFSRVPYSDPKQKQASARDGN